MSALSPASEMKDSGVQWIGDIPTEWKVRPVKALYSLTTGFTPSSEDDSLYDDDGETWVTISDLKSDVITDSKQKIAKSVAQQHENDIAKAGSLLYSFKLSVGTVAFAGTDLYTNEAIAAFQPISKEADLHYLRYASSLIVGNANTNIYGASIMNQKLILNAPLPLPSLSEQQTIADYLDDRCSQIDEIIAETTASIEEYLISPAGGFTKATDAGYDPAMALDIHTLAAFVKTTQPVMWQRFEKQCGSDPYRKFYKCFEDAVQTEGMLSVLRHGFKHRGMDFRVCYFKPESTLNQVAMQHYNQNLCQCIRQWHYSAVNRNSVDMMLAVNGIPVMAVELKNQLTGQSVDNAKLQWQYDRDFREAAFRLNHRILAFFALDLYEAWMATELKGSATYFLPFNQGSHGPGHDGGAGNPQADGDDYVTSYIWKDVLNKDSMMEILQKFISLEVRREKKKDVKGTEKTLTKKRLLFPRYHQLDVVRKLITDVCDHGSGRNYLIQHSAGSGKSNSIAWTAYRLASLHDAANDPVFTSVVIVTDRRNLDAQLQETVTGFDHTLGSVCAIDEKKSSKDLRDALNAGKRIIVTTLQKFPVIYEEVEEAKGKQFAIIVDEAHSSQTGESAMKLKAALADTSDALREYAELEGKAEEELPDTNDRLVREMISHGRHE